MKPLVIGLEQGEGEDYGVECEERLPSNGNICNSDTAFSVSCDMTGVLKHTYE